MKTVNRIPGKVLLFGEYSILNGSDALSIPCEHFYGTWKKNKLGNNNDLKIFLNYLLSIDQQLEAVEIDYEKFQEKLAQGFEFYSNIPNGVGFGSSGALVAGLIKEFGRVTDFNIKKLKSDLALIENIFHGNSSGFDPLVCFLNQAVYKRKDDLIIFENIKEHLDYFKSHELNFYLLDSGFQRSTSKMMSIFKNKKYSQTSQKEVIECVNQIANTFKNMQSTKLKSYYKTLCLIQWELFPEMFIDPLQKHSLQKLKKAGLWCKLLGAGGGGYFLMMETVPGTMNEFFPKNTYLAL